MALNPPSEDMKEQLETASALALTAGTNLFSVGHMPPTPDECVLVSDTGGFEPTNVLGATGSTIWKPTVQVLVRGNPGESRDAYLLAQACRDELHALANVTINGANYILVQAMGDILKLARDEKDRPLFSVNFRIERS